MSFSTNMQGTVLRLLEKLGDSCKLTKVITGDYNPATGKSDDFEEDIGTFSTNMENASLVLSNGGAVNFNLSGFSEEKVMIPYIKGYEIDDTWMYNDQEIQTVEKIQAQNNIIAYILEVKG